MGLSPSVSTPHPNSLVTKGKVKESNRLTHLGSVADGATDNTSAITAALASGLDAVETVYPERHLVTALTNPDGTEIDGSGAIVKTTAGGLQKLNTYADKFQRVTGQENLAAWYKLLKDQHTTPTRQLRVVFSGDSTTAGVGASSGYTIPELALTGITARGLQSPYNTVCINNGQSGAHTGQWETTHVHTDIAAAPDVLVLRWGINDPGWLKDGSTPPLDAGQDYANRRDVGDFTASLRAGLATVRASLGFSTTSIILMMPNSTFDTPNGRDALWYEQLRGVIVQAARDYQCAFIDTYAIMQDSESLANIMMDDPFADGRGIHPTDAMNSIIAGYIVDLLAPEGMRFNHSSNRFFNLGGAGLLPSVYLGPEAYTTGLYLSRAAATEAWPLDGSVVTFRSVDETVLQILYPYKNAERGQLKFRQGRAVSLAGEPVDWSAWYSLVIDGGFTNVSPVSGYSLPGSGQMRVAFSGTQAMFDGYISKTVPSAISSGTTIATIPAGYAPAHEAAVATAMVWSGAAYESVLAQVDTAGNITLLNSTGLVAARVYISCCYDNRVT